MAWRGQAALARPTPIGASGAALGGSHGGVDFASGTKGQRPLVFPACAGLRGRAVSAKGRCRAVRGYWGVCHMAHPLTRGSLP